MSTSLWRALAALLAVLQGTGAIAWWILMAGGFPLLHAQTAANRGVPALLALLALALALAAARGSERGCRRGIGALAGWWLGVAAAAPVIFPASLTRPSLLVVAALALALALVAVRSDGRRLQAAMVVPAVALGAAAVALQRAPAPSTRPLAALDAFPALPDAVCLHEGVVDADLGPVRVTLSPLLTFESVSPDRCWTALAPGDAWRSRPSRCVGEVVERDVLRVMFDGEARSSLEVHRHARGLEVEARAAVAAPIFSHLNTFTGVTLDGPGPLSISFSPCPERRFSFPDPGREPWRFAYVDAAGEFAVVDALAAEKGPFVERCRGALPAGTPLTLRIHSGDATVGELRILDWASQASVDLSPTAGWGVPQNAIELLGGGPGRGYLHFTLAATGVGRGWHSVGHEVGVYRNRVEIVSLAGDPR